MSGTEPDIGYQGFRGAVKEAVARVTDSSMYARWYQHRWREVQDQLQPLYDSSPRLALFINAYADSLAQSIHELSTSSRHTAAEAAMDYAEELLGQAKEMNPSNDNPPTADTERKAS